MASISNHQELGVNPPVSSVDQATDSIFPELSFLVEPIAPTLLRATVIVPNKIVSPFYEHAAHTMRSSTNARGFSQGDVPLEYVKGNFKEHLSEHLQELLFKLIVVGYLNNEIQAQKILVVGEPRLASVNLDINGEARYSFDMNVFHDIIINEWRYLPFKAPVRKKYKDLDRQVKSFISQEDEAASTYGDSGIDKGDWVNFNISLVDEQKTEILPDIRHNFWLRIGGDETENPLREIFIDQKAGNVIYTQNRGMQAYLSSHMRTHYTFRIEIIDVIPQRYFGLEAFRKYFRIKTKRAMHEKLVEVFSYRNHISQRMAIVQEMIHLLQGKNPFEVPNHLVLRQQQSIIESVRQSPDYNVYRAQRDFKDQVQQLAHRQVSENILIDGITYNENVNASFYDTKCYLGLLQRPRMKDFIYFESPNSRVMGQEVPIPLSIIKRACLREKATNYIIHHLTKD